MNEVSVQALLLKKNKKCLVVKSEVFGAFSLVECGSLAFLV